MGEELKTIGFATAVCLVCSLMLAGVYSGLKPEQDRNKAIDVKVKVLMAFGMDILDDSGRLAKSSDEIEEIFSSQIEGIVLDRDGNEVAEIEPGALTEAQMNVRDESGLKEYYPLYILGDPASDDVKYAIHVSGDALWSLVKGFLALEADLTTISGLAFYEHQETPGLGGEIEKDYFQSRFKKKRFMADGQVRDFRIVKPGQPRDESGHPRADCPPREPPRPHAPIRLPSASDSPPIARKRPLQRG